MSVEHVLLVSKAIYIPKSIQFIIVRGDNFQCSEEYQTLGLKCQGLRIVFRYS